MKAMPAITDEETWRRHNLRTALKYGRAGIKVFPNVDKYPSTICWQLDGDILTAADRAKLNAEHIAKKELEGKSVAAKPAHHIGATSDPNKIRRLWEEFPDATPSVSLGVSGLFVADADVDRATKNGEREACDGPALLAAMFDQNGFDAASTFSTTSRAGGKHFYFSNPLGLRNSGALKSAANVDLKGSGGYVVAPGSIRISDGKRYGGTANADLFIEAVKAGLPSVPGFIATKISAYTPMASDNDDAPERREGDSAQTVEIKELERSLREAGVSADVPVGAGVAFNVGKLMVLHHRVEKMHDPERDESQSGVRFRLLQQMRYLDKELTAIEGLAVCAQTPDAAGEYIGLRSRGADERGVFNLATFCRDWIRAGTKYTPPSDGGSFDVIDDEDETQLDESNVKFHESLYVMFARPDETFEDYKKRKEGQRDKKSVFKGQFYEDGPLSETEPTKYVYRQWFALDLMSLLVAPGARGKSVLCLSVAICLACGYDFFSGEKLYQPMRVFVFDAEDSINVMKKRIRAFMELHKISPEMRKLVSQNLIYQSGDEGEIILAISDKGVPTMNDKVVADMERAFKHRGVEYAFFNPLVRLHRVNENWNGDMSVVIGAMQKIMQRSGIGVTIAHHSRKTAGLTKTDKTADDARGGGSIVTGVRIVININPVPKEDWASYGITEDNQWAYLTVGSGDKSNHAPRSKNFAVYRTESVEADNGNERFPSETVVALRAVERQKPKGLTPGQIDEVLAHVRKGETLSSPRSDSYKALVDLIKGMEEGRTDEAAKSIVEMFVEKGWIDGEGVHKVNGKSKKAFRVGKNKPDLTTSFSAIDDEED